MELTKKIWIVIAVTIPVYLILFLLEDFNLIKKSFLSFDWNYLIFSILMIFSSQVIRGIRWHFWIKEISPNVPLRYSIVNYFSGLSLMATPARLGEAIRSLYLKKDHNLSYSSTTPLVIIERIYEIIGISILVSISILFVDFNLVQIFIPIILVIGITIITQKKKVLSIFLERLSKVKLISRFIPNAFESLETIHSTLYYKRLVPFSLISILVVLFDMIGIYFLIIGLEMNLNFPESVLITSSAILIGFLSFLPAGLLAVESSFIGFFLSKGISYSEITVFLILFRIVATVFLSLLGLITLRQISQKS